MIDLAKIEIENELWEEDAKLFEQMEGHYVSENEMLFFENIWVKMLSEYAPCGDLLLSSSTNEEEIYIDRVEYSEFVVGTGKTKAYGSNCRLKNECCCSMGQIAG